METGEILCCAPSKYIEWKIDHGGRFFLTVLGGIQSPRFPFAGAIWSFRILTNVERRKSDWRSIYLLRDCPDTDQHCMTGRLGIKKNTGEEYVSHSFRHTFGVNREWLEIDMFFSMTAFRRDLAVLTSSDKTTFFCSLLSISQGCKDVRTQTSPHKELGVYGQDESKEEANACAKGIYRLAEDVKNLFLNEKNCDTTIKVANREFHAHRLILGARSPVFASMYTHETTERSTGIVEIEDCSPEVFQDFLIFLYSGKLESLSWENATGLYAVADKYDLQEIKEECLTFITINLSVEHFCEAMTLALKYGQSELLKEATDFFVENARKITDTPSWQCFRRDHPVESKELYIQILERYIPD